MAKISFVGIFILFLYHCIGQSVYDPCISCIYLKEVGVKEEGGSNRGARVEEYLKAADGKPGDPWCSAFVKWVFDQVNIASTINVYSPTAQNNKNKVYFGKTWYLVPESGDVFCLYYSRLKRIGHAGFFHRQVNKKIYETIEGNSNEAGSREGIGVFKRKRSYNATHSISRWR